MAECPRCGGNAEIVEESHSIHLYRHTDEMAQCDDCGHLWAVRGIAERDPEAGLAFYLPESHLGAERPECPEHGRKMVATKYWSSENAVQFKCEEIEDGDVCQRLTTQPLKPAEEVA